MHDLFNGEARHVMEDARRLARENLMRRIGTEHLVLALFEQPQLGAVRLLQALGATKRRCWISYAKCEPFICPRVDEASMVHTSSLKRTVALATLRSIDARRESISVEDLLLGMLDLPAVGSGLRPDGIEILRSCVRDLEELRFELTLLSEGTSLLGRSPVLT